MAVEEPNTLESCTLVAVIVTPLGLGGNAGAEAGASNYRPDSTKVAPIEAIHRPCHVGIEVTGSCDLVQ